MRSFSKASAIVSVLATLPAAKGEIISDQPHALGGDRSYMQLNTPVHYQWAVDSFFDITYRIDFASPPHNPPAPGGGGGGSGGGAGQAVVSLNGLPPGEPWIGNMACSFFDVFVDLSPDGTTRTFDTEMLAMDLVGLPGGMMIRESPTLPSRGGYSVREVPGGMYHIDSFFDVFTELSLDGGQTWVPGDGPAHMRIFPAPGSGLALVLAGGIVGLRRRRA